MITNTLKSIICVTALGIANFAQGQYNLHSWFNFEEGVIPPGRLFRGHESDDSTLRVVRWNEPMIPREAFTPETFREIGNMGLGFRPDFNAQRHLSLISTTSMDRRRLQPGWKAVYQADFFIPEEGTPTATAALLAILPREEGKFSYDFYRFGLLDGGRNVFFSFQNSKPEPSIYFQQPIADFNLKRPGWHRFQIIFEGTDKISCAIDTVETAFSPIMESTLTVLHPGLMATANKAANPFPVFADNLSIQWTNEPNAPLPDSPWRDVAPSSRPAPVAAVANAPTMSPEAIYDEKGGLPWHTDPQKAWEASQTSKKPILTLFYAPRIGPFEYLKSITPNTAPELLRRFELLLVDANQLAGGKLASDYKVYRLPTIVVIGTNGQETGRAVVINRQTQWAELETALTAVAP